MALELPGPISSDFFVKSLLRICRNGPGASWANSIRVPYQILFRNVWKIVLELPAPIPYDFFIRFLLEVDGNCFWSSLGHFQQMSAFNLP